MKELPVVMNCGGSAGMGPPASGIHACAKDTPMSSRETHASGNACTPLRESERILPEERMPFHTQYEDSERERSLCARHPHLREKKPMPCERDTCFCERLPSLCESLPRLCDRARASGRLQRLYGRDACLRERPPRLCERNTCLCERHVRFCVRTHASARGT